MILSRNRYGNVQPWEQSRIKLKVPIDGSDYINASPIRLASKPARSLSGVHKSSAAVELSTSTVVEGYESRYIAAQGPKDGQFAHFWNMVMQETLGEVGVIVMLTPCWEGNRGKCGQYFPTGLESPVLQLAGNEKQQEDLFRGDDGDPFRDSAPVGDDADSEHPDQADPITHHNPGSTDPNGINEAGDRGSVGHDTVTLLEIYYEEACRSEVRKLRLQKGEQSKIIWHYLFTGWPDYAKPEGEDRRALLELIKQSAYKAGEASFSPRFVHCSAGVGRTGTFIALDYLLRELGHGHLSPTISHSSTSFYPIAQPPGLQRSSSKPKQRQRGELRADVQKDDESLPATTLDKATTGMQLGNKGENGRENIVGMAAEGFQETAEIVGAEEEEGEEGEGEDIVFQTVNTLREQRMMMVMNEIQLQFLYEVLREAYLEMYPQNANSAAQSQPQPQPQLQHQHHPSPSTSTSSPPPPASTTAMTATLQHDDLNDSRRGGEEERRAEEPSPKLARTGNMQSVGPTS